jgi:hypothetical protein
VARFQVSVILCSDILLYRMPAIAGQALRLPGCSALLISGSTSRAVSSVVERLLHTQEVAGSNPAPRIFFLF